MFLYRFITSIILIVFGPSLTLRFKGRERQERLGRLKHGFDSCIWIHAASMGEVNAVKTLINELLQKYPHHDFVLSTMTATGQEAARKISPKLTTIFLPLDFGRFMKRLFKKLNPELIILVETEFWPNMLYRAKKYKIPVLVVNARISDKSYPKYKFSRCFWKSLWKAIAAVNAQSDKDAERFRLLKFNQVQNTHNLKFCVELPYFEKDKLRTEFGYKPEEKVIVWGSSRPGEEKLFEKIIIGLKEKNSQLKFIVVPRHLHRLPEIKSIFKEINFSTYSNFDSKSKLLIVDEMGILNTFYALADLAIVGGSFYNFGGHNPLEPAFYGKPIIIGNHHTSCRDSVDRLLENNGIIVSRKDKLLADIQNLLNEPEKAANLGLNAKNTLQLNSDSLNNNLNIIKKYIPQK